MNQGNGDNQKNNGSNQISKNDSGNLTNVVNALLTNISSNQANNSNNQQQQQSAGPSISVQNPSIPYTSGNEEQKTIHEEKKSKKEEDTKIMPMEDIKMHGKKEKNAEFEVLNFPSLESSKSVPLHEKSGNILSEGTVNEVILRVVQHNLVKENVDAIGISYRKTLLKNS